MRQIFSALLFFYYLGVYVREKIKDRKLFDLHQMSQMDSGTFLSVTDADVALRGDAVVQPPCDGMASLGGSSRIRSQSKGQRRAWGSYRE